MRAFTLALLRDLNTERSFDPETLLLGIHPGKQSSRVCAHTRTHTHPSALEFPSRFVQNNLKLEVQKQPAVHVHATECYTAMKEEGTLTRGQLK